MTFETISKYLKADKIETPHDIKFNKQVEATVKYLKTIKGNILLISTSSRSLDSKDIPKSLRLAKAIQKNVGDNCNLVDVAKLQIFPCEGCVSSNSGNICGTDKSKVEDNKKSPDGNLKCWAALHNQDDEIWRVALSLFKAEVVIFLGSVRWGSANAIYQKLMERLTWIENRATTLGEDNLIKNIKSGAIFVGQNWNGAKVVELQKQVHKWYGFKPVDDLYFNWQFGDEADDESVASYKEAIHGIDDFVPMIRDIK